MPKKEKAVGDSPHSSPNLSALARLLPTPKPKLTRGAKRRKKKA